MRLCNGGFDLRLLAAADAATEQPRRNDLGVVDHQRIAGPQQIRQIAHDPVFGLRARVPVAPPSAARNRAATRSQRDAFGRQVEIEE